MRARFTDAAGTNTEKFLAVTTLQAMALLAFNTTSEEVTVIGLATEVKYECYEIFQVQ